MKTPSHSPIAPKSKPSFAEPDPRRQLALYAALGRKLAERVGPLAHALLSGAKSADPELRAFAATTAQERLIGVGGIAGHLDAVGALRPGLSFERARDILWTLNAWGLYELLVLERGWSLDDWESWIASRQPPYYSDNAQRSVCIAERPNGLIKARSVIGSAGSRSSVRAQGGKVEAALAAKT
jgi:hypothetical protein